MQGKEAPVAAVNAKSQRHSVWNDLIAFEDLFGALKLALASSLAFKVPFVRKANIGIKKFVLVFSHVFKRLYVVRDSTGTIKDAAAFYLSCNLIEFANKFLCAIL